MPLPILLALAPIAAMAVGKGAGYVARNMGDSRLSEAEAIIENADSFTSGCQYQFKEIRSAFLLEIHSYIEIAAENSGRESPDPIEIDKLPKRVKLFYDTIIKVLREEPRSISFIRIMEAAKSHTLSGARAAVSLNRAGHPLLASLAGAVAGASEGFAYKAACEAYKSAAITAAEKSSSDSRALLYKLTREISDHRDSFNELISDIDLNDNPSTLWPFLLDYYDLVGKHFQMDDEK